MPAVRQAARGGPGRTSGAGTEARGQVPGVPGLWLGPSSTPSGGVSGEPPAPHRSASQREGLGRPALSMAQSVQDAPRRRHLLPRPSPAPTAPQPPAAACRPAYGKVGSKAERSHSPQAHKETHPTCAPCLGPCPLGPCPALHPSAPCGDGLLPHLSGLGSCRLRLPPRPIRRLLQASAWSPCSGRPPFLDSYTIKG